MKKVLLALSALAAVFIFTACQKGLNNPQGKEPGKTNESVTGISTILVATTPCGTPLITDMETSGGLGGKLEVSNDQNNVYIKVSSTVANYNVSKIKIAYGDLNHLNTDIQYSGSEAEGIINPDILVNVSPAAASYTVTIPAANLTSCFLLIVHATLTNGNAAQDIPMWTKALVQTDQIYSYPWTQYIQYCKQDCPPPPGDCGQLRTQTPGGWGSVPNGNNPSAYLHANFSTVFSNGLAIGCYPGDYYVRFTNAQAITDLLPTGGEAKVLTQNYLNPSDPSQLKNTLVSHLTALTLSVGFDAADPNFGQAGIQLGDMKIGSGTFANWTVKDFLAEANKVLGGCSNAYTPKQVLETASAINENYVDGKVNLGFLVCPD